MSTRARSFLVANATSPVVYASVDDGRVTYRLANGTIFRLNAHEARQAPHPRWAFAEREAGAAALSEYERMEAETLAKVQAESVR